MPITTTRPTAGGLLARVTGTVYPGHAAVAAQQETMAGDEGPLPGVPSPLAAISAAIGHLSWERTISFRLEARAMFDKILVAVDHSEVSDRALDAARELALLSRGEVWVLHLREREVAVKTGVSLSNESMDEASAAVAAAVDKLTAAGVKAHGDVGTTLFGYAARNIVDDAKEHDVDVIVMGSRGRGDLAGLILGSTAHKVIHLADRPVLIVR
jgi:nucleotide-binding universal stress UspA family protein